MFSDQMSVDDPMSIDEMYLFIGDIYQITCD